MARDREYERALHHVEHTLPCRADLDAFTRQVSQFLPGDWTVSLQDWTEPRHQHALCGFLWDNAHLS